MVALVEQAQVLTLLSLAESLNSDSALSSCMDTRVCLIKTTRTWTSNHESLGLHWPEKQR